MTRTVIKGFGARCAGGAGVYVCVYVCIAVEVESFNAMERCEGEEVGEVEAAAWVGCVEVCGGVVAGDRGGSCRCCCGLHRIVGLI